jgi:hypothetical protein
LAQFEQYVSQGQIHYFVASGREGGFGGGALGGGPGGFGGFGGGGAGGAGGGQLGGSDPARQITAWVEQHFTAVQIGGQTFYDLTQPLS